MKRLVSHWITPPLLALLVAGSLLAPTIASAAANTGLQLNGTTQYVTFGAAPGLGASSFTLETWFNRTGTGVGTSTGTGGLASAIPLVTKGRAQAETPANLNMNYFLGIDFSTGQLVADFEDTAGGLNHPVTGTAVVTSNTWHHAAATYTAGTWNLYLDGVLDKTLPVSGSPIPESTSIQHAALGTAMTSTGVAAGFFQGIMDESRIWNVARTQGEIQTGMPQEITSDPAGLIGRWGMNEGSGSTVADSSGSGVTGTAVASPTWVAGFVPPAAAPNQPVLNAPADGATGLSTDPVLDVTVSDPENAPLDVTFYGRPYASGGFQAIDTSADVPSGSNATTTWSAIGSGQEFEWYVVVDNGAASTTGPTWRFHTAQGTDPVFVGAGDIGSCSSADDTATGQLIQGVDGTVFTTGDNAYPNGTPTDFSDCYDPVWGQVLPRTHPVPGNHDWNTGTLDGYNGYFGPNATDVGGKSYYSYDINTAWHVVNLDSECARVAGGCAADSPQETWLQADLADHAGQNVIALWHKPRFSSGSTNLTDVQPFWDDLYAAGADIVLVGHDHIYERFAPMNALGQLDTSLGVRQFTVGTGGESHHGIGTAKPTSEVRNNTTFGILKLTLHADSYDWVFLPIAGQTFTDAGTSPTNSPLNTTPTADGQSVDTAKNTPLTVTLSGSDADGDDLSFAIETAPQHGSLGSIDTPSCSSGIGGSTCTADVIYTPGTSFVGSDSFEFSVNDGTSTGAPAQISITVTGTNAPPVVDSVSILETAPSTDDTLHSTVAAHDPDGDAVVLAYQWQRDVGSGFANIPGATSPTLDLSGAGNGDAGDLVRVVVTPSDGAATGSASTSAAVTVAGTVSTYTLQVSTSSGRSSPSALDGATVSGDIYVFVLPESGATRVRFWLDNPAATGTPFKNKKAAPFDFAGTRTNGTAKPYDSTGLSDGSHSITIKVTLTGGSIETTTATFTVNNGSPPPPPPSTYALQVSTSSGRSSPSALDGATVSGDIYVFVLPESGATGVRFWLDNPAATGTPLKIDGGAPFDFVGTRTNGMAKPYDSTGLSDGSHSITIKVTLTGGSIETTTATFTVNNSSPPSLDSAWRSRI